MYDWTEEDARAYAATMKKFIRWDYRPWARRIHAVVQGRYRDARVGDIACGPGYLSLELARLLRRCHITFTDASEMMLSIAAEGAQAAGLPHTTVACGAEQLDLDEGSLDICLCKQFLHEAADWKATLEQLYRVLAPRGRAVLIDFDAESSSVGARMIQAMVRLTGGKQMARMFWTSYSQGLPRSLVLRQARALGFQRVQVLARGPSYFIVVEKP